MGNYTSLKNVLQDAAQGGTNILSFRSSRGKLRTDHSIGVGTRRIKLVNSTFLQTYNCDTYKIPRPASTERACKQIYRSDYVLHRFVHYSLVTQGLVHSTYNQTSMDQTWRNTYVEPNPSERFTDETTEAVMIHAKSITPAHTHKNQQHCHNNGLKSSLCFVAFPWPDTTNTSNASLHDADGMAYNCYINHHVDHYWAPRLQTALNQRQHPERPLIG
jgi:hypothetical protein